jgi:hypothetical protein
VHLSNLSPAVVVFIANELIAYGVYMISLCVLYILRSLQSDRFPAALNSTVAEAGRRGWEVQGVPHLEHDARHHDGAVRYR